MSRAPETLVAHLRPHGRAMFWPVVLLVLVAAAYGFFAGGFREEWQQVTALSVAAALAVFGFLIPLWRWSSDRYTITTRRVIVRTGIVRRARRELPLALCQEVTLHRSAGQSLFRTGDIVIESGSDDPLVLRDTPSAGLVQATLTDLIDDEASGRFER